MTLGEFQQQAAGVRVSPRTQLVHCATSKLLMRSADDGSREDVAKLLGRTLIAIATLATEYDISLSVAAHKALDDARRDG